MKCQILFSRKIRKNINLLSAELVKSMIKVNYKFLDCPNFEFDYIFLLCILSLLYVIILSSFLYCLALLKLTCQHFSEGCTALYLVGCLFIQPTSI